MESHQPKGGTEGIAMSEMMMVIRADAGPQIGIGHVMRCLALAQAWQKVGGTATFALAAEVPALEERLLGEGMQVTHVSVEQGSAEDAQQTVRLAREKKAKWVVVDGYHFGAEYQRALKARGLRTFWIDDYGHAESYTADWVLNQNIHADESFYFRRKPYTRLLLGTRYVLLRQEFLSWQGWRRGIPEVARRVLVTMGGADPDNKTLAIIRALDEVEVDGLEVMVIVGCTNPRAELLKTAVVHTKGIMRLKENTSQISELMAWADLAISAGGTTCWELAFMGVPMVTLILAENQRLSARILAERGISICLEEGRNENPQNLLRTVSRLVQDRNKRRSMIEAGQCLVDGSGVKEIIKVLARD
jgi:UDP-2,4-diacetamido-2,4,6-trideoxy-beta-L-altropyranose hydrolase